uniref:LIM zinc-binding domain-containing protein n=1 Tax=Panagrolaimus superbus TaxID=310955 RepID=A0A914XU92_9BILA
MISQHIIPENICLTNPPPQNSYLFEDPLLALSHSLTNFVELTSTYGTNFLTHHQLLHETTLFHPFPSTSETTYQHSMIPLNDLNLSPALTITPSTTTTTSSSTMGILPCIGSLELNNNYIPNNIDLGSLTICEFCGIQISAKTLFVVDGKNFHEACLRCYECGIQLDEKCYYRDGAIFCKNDYLQ